MDEDWRKTINADLNRVCVRVGAFKFKDVRTLSYKALEEKSGIDLNRALDALKSKLTKSGLSKSKVKKASKLDVVDGDPSLRRIYGNIVSDLVSKYCI
jgi:hypothetical protein